MPLISLFKSPRHRPLRRDEYAIRRNHRRRQSFDIERVVAMEEIHPLCSPHRRRSNIEGWYRSRPQRNQAVFIDECPIFEELTIRRHFEGQKYYRYPHGGDLLRKAHIADVRRHYTGQDYYQRHRQHPCQPEYAYGGHCNGSQYEYREPIEAYHYGDGNSSGTNAVYLEERRPASPREYGYRCSQYYDPYYGVGIEERAPKGY